MTSVRRPAVAGSFYPADRSTLVRQVDTMLAEANPPLGPPPQAMIQPHAGYVYSGPVAAMGYRRLGEHAEGVHRVAMLGPAHTVALQGIAVSGVDAWATPLGEVPVDRQGRRGVVDAHPVMVDDAPHVREHAIEVQLPFLQRLLHHGWTMLPIVVGAGPVEPVALMVDDLLGDGVLIIVSSDLSHYEPIASARRHDARTVAAILERRPEAIGPYDACGCFPIRALLASRTAASLEAEVLDVRTSGDTAGPEDRVVGYASVVFNGAA